jgi:caffeoyl-CoA O-methyltransferase
MDADLDAYAERVTTPPPDYLVALDAETHATQDSPQMLTGPVAGRLLDMLVWTAQARRVLEIGTYTGYSALTMAAALGERGSVITCELDPDRAAFARRHLDASPYGDRVEIRVGPALETVRGLEGPFDQVFIDADKTGYPDYLEASLPLLAPRGVIVLDNMLRGGRVLAEDGDEGTRAVRDLALRLAEDPRVVTVLLTVRDGMLLVRRRDPAPGPAR